MAKDVTIYQKSTSYHYSSVDRIQTKGLDEESHIDWLPEDECITGFRKITKNGVYQASADGFAGYTAVFVDIPAIAISGVGSDGVVYRIQRDPNGNLIKTILSTGEVVKIDPNYLAIPSHEYEGQSITSFNDSTVNVIGEDAFASCVSLSGVNFPEVHTVKSGGFSDCVTLSNAAFPKLQVIGEGAFKGCVSLVRASFPACTYIGSSAFWECSNLKTIDLSGSSMCMLASSNAFFGTSTRFMVASELHSFYIKARAWSDIASRVRIYGMIEIFPREYYNDLTITSFTDMSVTDICEEAFWGCSNLSQVNFPKANNIESGAFEYCTSLKSVNFPKVKKLGEFAFAFCSSLTTAIFPELVSMESSIHSEISEDRVFGNQFAQTPLREVSMPKLETIAESAFEYTKLENVAFPAALSVGTYAFHHCTSLKTISLPNARKVGAAFYSCTYLQSVSLPKLESFTEDGVFSFCKGLSTVFIGASKVVELPPDPLTGEDFVNNFINTPMLDSAYLGYFGSIIVPASLVAAYKANSTWKDLADRITHYPPSVPSPPPAPLNVIGGEDGNHTSTYVSSATATLIEEFAFNGNENLISASFPKCRMIEGHTFDNCPFLKDIYFPELMEIGGYAFQGCRMALSRVELPNLREIVGGAFYSCHELSYVTMPKLERLYGGFESCHKLTSVYLLGSTVVDLPYAAANYVFENTPITTLDSAYNKIGRYGSIYVPSSLANTYRNRGGWTEIRDRIVGI